MNTQKIFVCPNCKCERLAIERHINGDAICLNCKWEGPAKDLIEVISVSEGKYELYYQAIIGKLETEITQLKSELSIKDSHIKEIIDIVQDFAEGGNIDNYIFLCERLEKFNEV